jgi:hypothetical protein
VKLSRTLPALLVASMAIVAACGGDDDDAARMASEDSDADADDTSAEGTEDPSNDGAADPCTFGQNAVEQLLAGATCEHTTDGIEDETAVWSRDGETVLSVEVFGGAEFTTMESEQADPLDVSNTYEAAPELGERAWILTGTTGIDENIVAYLETEPYPLVNVSSPTLERADVVAIATAVQDDIEALS